MKEKDRKEPVLDTPELILKDAIVRFRKLDDEAHDALYQERDAVKHRQKLIERTRLIADLPAKVVQLMEKGQSFPEEKLQELKFFSALAHEGLKNGKTFALRVILIPRGSRVGDPNLLEELVNELYPSSKTDFSAIAS